jgi:tryptophan synthase beta chain
MLFLCKILHTGDDAMVDMTKILLDEAEIPKAWFNLVPHLQNPPAPPLHPATHQPVGPADLAPLFCDEILGQEMTTEPEIEIPAPVWEIYRLWRPTPLYRARRLEKALDTPAHIYYKYEGVSPAGSHKPNTAVAQAF